MELNENLFKWEVKDDKNQVVDSESGFKTKEEAEENAIKEIDVYKTTLKKHPDYKFEISETEELTEAKKIKDLGDYVYDQLEKIGYKNIYSNASATGYEISKKFEKNLEKAKELCSKLNLDCKVKQFGDRYYLNIELPEEALAEGLRSLPKSTLTEDINDLFTRSPEFRYQLLSRMIQDCKYFLGAGNRYEKHLWANTVDEHIDIMKKLYNSFPDDQKPEWTSIEEIEEFEKQMKAPKEVNESLTEDVSNEKLDKAYNGSYYTIIGVGGDINEWKEGYQELLNKENIGQIKEFIEFTGKEMNDTYNLTGDNRYNDDLHFLAFPVTGLNIGKLAIFKLRMGDRWFDDIVDENKHKETKNDINEKLINRTLCLENSNEYSLAELQRDIWSKIREFYSSFSDEEFEEFVKDYTVVEIKKENTRVKVEVRMEASYRTMDKLADILNPLVQKLDKDAYFDHEDSGIINAYVHSKYLKEDYEEEKQFIKGPRGNFELSTKTKAELEKEGYTYHHQFEKNDRIYIVMIKDNNAVACIKESLKEEYEDIQQNIAQETITKNEKETGLAKIVSDLLKDELEAIEGYESAIVNFEVENKGEYTNILRDIIAEENNHIGQLQKIMDELKPQTIDNIEDGQEEAQEQITADVNEIGNE